MNKIIALLLCFLCNHAIVAQAATYGLARSATPVLNFPAFRSVFGGADGKTLKTDRCGQLRELEFIALPGTVFSILEKLRNGAETVYRVETDDYPASAKGSLYVDSRFVEIREIKPPSRPRSLPSRAAIIAGLKGAVGVPYVWGGNIQGGVGELIELFYAGDVPGKAKGHLTLAGLDCSGLLYQATGGWTPRNTTQLLAFGTAVPVAGKTLEEIAGSLEALDLIVWNGHVVIVLDQETTIESRLECDKQGGGGVVLNRLHKRLTEIMRSRRPLDRWPVDGKQRSVFVVRRWVLQ